MAGKYSAILTYIDEWKKPILVAGDTPISDGYMMFHATDTANGGINLWIDRKPKYLDQIRDMQRSHTQAQRDNGLAITADKNWLTVTAEQIQ